MTAAEAVTALPAPRSVPHSPQNRLPGGFWGGHYALCILFFLCFLCSVAGARDVGLGVSVSNGPAPQVRGYRSACGRIVTVPNPRDEDFAPKAKALRDKGVIKTPEDLGIDRDRANRSLLAAKSVRELVDWSDGLYDPPARFRNW